MKKIEYMNLKKNSKKKIEDHIFTIYKQILKKADEEMKTLPEKDFIKIHYEDLTKNNPCPLKKFYKKIKHQIPA